MSQAIENLNQLLNSIDDIEKRISGMVDRSNVVNTLKVEPSQCECNPMIPRTGCQCYHLVDIKGRLGAALKQGKIVESNFKKALLG